MATDRTPRAPRVKVSVTRQLIDEAVPRDSSHCMIAEAVREAYPDAKHVAVDLQTIRFTDPKRSLRFTYLTPRIGQVALVHWDDGTKPEPFEMTLRGGQVTRSGSTQKRAGQDQSEAQRQQRQAAGVKAQQKLRKTRLAQQGRNNGLVPDRVGGKTPPITKFANRRAFGLRGLIR